MASGTNRGGHLKGEAKGVITTTCGLCGSEVTKRKSFAVDDIRVCKNHTFTAQQMGLWQAQKRMGAPLTLLVTEKVAVA